MTVGVGWGGRVAGATALWGEGVLGVGAGGALRDIPPMCSNTHTMPNTLYYGDNLAVLRDHVRDDSVDLVYLDPPFNSNASYNVLFREKSGEESPAQIRAFTDTWEWTLEAQRTYENEIMLNPSTPANVKDMVSAFRGSSAATP